MSEWSGWIPERRRRRRLLPWALRGLSTNPRLWATPWVLPEGDSQACTPCRAAPLGVAWLLVNWVSGCSIFCWQHRHLSSRLFAGHDVGVQCTREPVQKHLKGHSQLLDVCSATCWFCVAMCPRLHSRLSKSWVLACCCRTFSEPQTIPWELASACQEDGAATDEAAKPN